MTRPAKFFDDAIEPAPKCRNCEYFDGGGLSPEGSPIREHGDCLNRQSLRWQTSADDGCDKFFPCSTRWPGADHD